VLSRLLQAVGFVVTVAVAAIAFTPLTDRVVVKFSTPPGVLQPAAAIVVLGAGSAHGVLSEASLRRAVHGIQLYRRGLAPTLVFSGGPEEADLRTRLAVELGVPAASILTEKSARTTREEGQRIADLLRHEESRRILLVVEAPAARRASGVFARLGFQVLPAPVTDAVALTKPERRLQLAREMLMEACALAYYRLAGYL
jgi:uncharacterized SAM-binding protein YcdF (DUF218 family)